MISRILIALITLEHLYFMVLEMFLWKKPFGQRTFGMTAEFAEQTAALAANQGLYNGFLAAGLGFSVVRGDVAGVVFFLVCVALAGVYGGISVKRTILFLQGIPAGIALVLVLLGY